MARFSERVRMMYAVNPDKAMRCIIEDNFSLHAGELPKLYNGDEELERLQYEYCTNNRPNYDSNIKLYIKNLEEYMFKYIKIAIEDDLKENPVDENIKQSILRQMNEKNY